MADYVSDIPTDDYLYIKEISITETGGEDHTNFPVKLTLNSSNFNFELAESDGVDFRVGEGSNGTRILNMWIATWDTINRIATIWFKIPSLLANETKNLYVYFGNSNDSGISDADSVGFIFADGFESLDVGTNVALNKTSDQSNIYTTGTESDKAVDGSLSTLSHTTNGSNEWWKVDLGANYTISIIYITKQSGYGDRPQNYYIQTADDYTFTTNVVNIITAESESSEDIVYTTNDFGSVTARYLRVYAHSSNQYVNFREFRVYVDYSKWIAVNVNSVFDSKIRINTNGYIEAQGFPLSGITNWIVEEGVYVAAGGDSTYQAYRPRFYGTENNFGYNYYVEGNYDRQSNLVNSSSWVTYNGIQKGLESDSYSENYIAYYESTDKVYQSMKNRSSYVDYTDNVERQVYGDTRVTYFRIYGRNNAAAPYVDIDWIIVREFFLTDPYSFDTSNLFVTWEQINPQSIDWVDYGSDLTNTNYYHYSSYGGDPYRLSDNTTGATTDCWYSDSNTVVSGIDLIIDFARGANNLVSTDYLHYDDGHVGFKNASKLSNNDEDVWGNNYFESTTTSGYVCVDFEGNNVAVGCLAVKAYTIVSGMAKNFIFKGSYEDPRLSTDDEWDVLYTGMFENSSDWQPIYIANGKPYRYYKLDVLDTYNGGPITIQEWGMYEYFSDRKKMIISQLRLRPITFESSEVYFPKWITLEGSNSLNEWDTLISTKKTYTPFQDYVWERWQRFSFTNTKGYYRYKLTCSGTWSSDVNKMGISEWEMVERADESYTYRILDGSSNNFNSIWANDDSTFDEGFIYIANDNLNIVKNNFLADSTVISGTIIDVNVINI